MARPSFRIPTHEGAREGVELEPLIVAVLDGHRDRFAARGLRIRIEPYPVPLRVRARRAVSLSVLEELAIHAAERAPSGDALIFEPGRAHDEVFVRIRTDRGEEIGEARGPWLREERLAGVSVALLAGGRSQRMGRNKGLIEWRGATFLQRLIEVLGRLTDDLFVCGDADGVYRELGVPVLPDSVRGCGPLGGIATALATARHPRCFIAPCDVPLLDPRLVDALAWRASEGRTVVLRSPSGIEPLVGVYSKHGRDEIEAALREGRPKVQELLARLDSQVVDLSAELPYIDPRCLANVNTPEDLQRFLALDPPPGA